jgi:cysteine desulfurase / selenocysteine lyase
MTMESFRAEMPISKRFAYFDHAAVAPLPHPAVERLTWFAKDASQNGDTNWLEWSAGIGRFRSLVAKILNVSDKEVALVSNTTHGINLIAEGFPWKSGDNVVVPDNEFPSNLLPWRNLERRGIEIRLAKIPPNGVVSVDQVTNLMDSKTRLVAISWVGFASGFRIAVEQFVQAIHDRGALVFLDAIQGLGVFPLDAMQTDVDFLAADGHKWMLGPEGAGILYIKQQHLNLLNPLMLGWNSLASGGFDPTAVHLKTSAARYEGGSLNMAGFLALDASLTMLSQFGFKAISQAVLDNVGQLAEMLRSEKFDVHVPLHQQNRSGILSVDWQGANPMATRKHCINNDVIVSVRGGRLRISAHAYNNLADMQRLVSALCDARKHTNT